MITNNSNARRLAQNEAIWSRNNESYQARQAKEAQVQAERRQQAEDKESSSKYQYGRNKTIDDVKQYLTARKLDPNNPRVAWLFLAAYRRANGDVWARVSRAAGELERERDKYLDAHRGTANDSWPPAKPIRPGDAWEKLRKSLSEKGELP